MSADAERRRWRDFDPLGKRFFRHSDDSAKHSIRWSTNPRISLFL